ncbi:hypothetical protein DMUE_2852 [Dictyocoela muelleri]|nr:hypothetical protein DMUE_2852 [Dictyocoela muelleri]
MNNLPTFESKPNKVIYDNKRSDYINEYTDLMINTIENKQMYLLTKFSIIKNLSEDIILGNTFLKNNNNVIDFSKNVILFNNIKFNIESSNVTKWNNFPDYQLLCKNDINNFKIARELFLSDIEDILQKVQKNNPELGKLPSIGFKITLKDDIPISSKPYPIVYKLNQQVKEEINKFIRLKIIRKSK